MHLFCQLSNLLGFFPVWYCVENKDYQLAAMMAVCFGFSMIYHIDEESELGLFIDLCGVGILLGALLFTLKKSVENHSDLTVANFLTVIFILSSFACYLYAVDMPTNSKEYAFFHSCWHILTVYGITTFLYSFFTDRDKSKFLCLRVIKRKSGSFGTSHPVGSAIDGIRTSRNAVRKESVPKNIDDSAEGRRTGGIKAPVTFRTIHSGNGPDVNPGCAQPCRKDIVADSSLRNDEHRVPEDLSDSFIDSIRNTLSPVHCNNLQVYRVYDIEKKAMRVQYVG